MSFNQERSGKSAYRRDRWAITIEWSKRLVKGLVRILLNLLQCQRYQFEMIKISKNNLRLGWLEIYDKAYTALAWAGILEVGTISCFWTWDSLLNEIARAVREKEQWF